MDTNDHYATLGVARTATAEELRRAYRKLARKHHPDVASDPQSEENAKAGNAASDVLKDPEPRAENDNPRAQQEFSGSPNWDGGFGFSRPGTGGGVKDIFDSIYRSDPHASGFGGGMLMVDQRARIEIPLPGAFLDTIHERLSTWRVPLPR